LATNVAEVKSVSYRAIAASAVFAGAISAASLAAAPAHADASSDMFLNALNGAGVGYGDPNAAVSLGQSVCPVLAQPGGSFSNVASNVVGNAYGMSPQMASFFTTIAIQAFCPQVIAQMADGSWINGINGVPGINGIPGIAGMNGMPNLF
jgi:hypothetical protein